MGFRMRKSIKIVPGVRLNLSTSGVGYSVGGKGVRVTRHANGRISRTALPGTGLSHQTTLRPARPHSGARNSRALAQLPPPPEPRSQEPGLLAPKWEKDLFAVLTSTQPADYIAIARKHGHAAPHARVLAATLEGLLHFERGADQPNAEARARSLLGWVAVQAITERMEQFATTYLAGRTWPVEIVPGLTATLHLHDDVVH